MVTLCPASVAWLVVSPSQRAFEYMSKEVEEDEHSLEMQLPFIRHIIGEQAIPIIPILVGSVTPETEKEVARCVLTVLLGGAAEENK